MKKLILASKEFEIVYKGLIETNSPQQMLYVNILDDFVVILELQRLTHLMPNLVRC